METRTTSRDVTFRHPFRLRGIDGDQRPGTYTMSVEEEQLDMLSFTGWRQVATTLQVHTGAATEYFAVDSQELRAALLQDSRQSNDPPPAPAVAGSPRVREILHLRRSII